MKLSLDELSIDSYACQMSDFELTRVKGGDDLTPTILVVGAVLLLESCVQVNVNVVNQNTHSGNNTVIINTDTVGAVPNGLPPKQK